ncbi:MAG: TonB family protein, partial [Myxococcales bacterium]|nr:TonB family protein [Myxococcales bacterium]
PKPTKAPPKPQRPKPQQRRAVAKAQAAKRAERAAARVAQQQQAQVAKAMAALQRFGGGPKRSDLLKAVTNVAAVRSSRASKFSIAGAVQKLPGSSVRLAGSGGGADTKAGAQLLANSQVGRLQAGADTGRRGPRGRVARAPSRSIQATGGVLSRAAIQGVISSHMSEVQSCYERQLLGGQRISGKILFQWVISPSGGVLGARQVSSSLGSPAVAQCILRALRGWRFPKPQGGSVTVRYPFVFRVQRF